MATNKNNKKKNELAVAKEQLEWDSLHASQEIINAINEHLPYGSPLLLPIPPTYRLKRIDRQTVADLIHASFEITGGVSRLAAWGLENPDKFFPLYAKLVALPEEGAASGGVAINIVSTVPASPLDDRTVELKWGDEPAVDIDFDDQDD
jgi:hypothetical protein